MTEATHTSGPRPDAAARRRRRLRSAVMLETLEGRALLSHVPAHVATLAARHQNLAATTLPYAPPPANPHPGPILNEVGTGFAVKSARFYPFYTGAKRAELNAMGAKGVLDNSGNVVLTGIVAANAVPQTSTGPSTDAFYVFGINRGAAPFPGPFPGRTAITIDSAVVVGITSAGISASVTDLTTGTTTPIDPTTLVFKQNAIQVTVPSTLLPGIGRGSTVNFYTANSPAFATGDYTTVASFAPEFRNFPLAIGVIPHHGGRY